MMDRLNDIKWFSALGTFQALPGQMALPGLHAWNGARMDWLPT